MLFQYHDHADRFTVPECELSRLVCPAESCRWTGALALIGGGGLLYQDAESGGSCWTAEKMIKDVRIDIEFYVLEAERYHG